MSVAQGLNFFISASKTKQKLHFFDKTVRTFIASPNGKYKICGGNQSSVKSNKNLLDKRTKISERMKIIKSNCLCYRVFSKIQIRRFKSAPTMSSPNAQKLIITHFSKLYDAVSDMLKWKRFRKAKWTNFKDNVYSKGYQCENRDLTIKQNRKFGVHLSKAAYERLQTYRKVNTFPYESIESFMKTLTVKFQTNIQSCLSSNHCYHKRDVNDVRTTLLHSDGNNKDNYHIIQFPEHTAGESKSKMQAGTNKLKCSKYGYNPTKTRDPLLSQTSSKFSEILFRKNILNKLHSRYFNKEDEICSTDSTLKSTRIMNNESTSLLNSGINYFIKKSSPLGNHFENSDPLIQWSNNRFRDTQVLSVLHYLKLYSTIIQVHTLLQNRCFGIASRCYGTIKSSQPILEVNATKTRSNNLFECIEGGGVQDNPDAKGEMISRINSKTEDNRDIFRNYSQETEGKSEYEILNDEPILEKIVAETACAENKELPGDICESLVKSLIFSRQILSEIKEIPFVARNKFNKANKTLKQTSPSKHIVMNKMSRWSADDKTKSMSKNLPNVYVAHQELLKNDQKDKKSAALQNMSSPDLKTESLLVKKDAPVDSFGNETITFKGTKEMPEAKSMENLDVNISSVSSNKIPHAPKITTHSTNNEKFTNRLEASKKQEKPILKFNIIDPNVDIVLPKQTSMSHSGTTNISSDKILVVERTESETDTKREKEEKLKVMPNEQLYSHFIKNVNSSASQMDSNLTIDYTLSLVPKDPITKTADKDKKTNKNSWQIQKSGEESGNDSFFAKSMFGENVDVPFYKEAKTSPDKPDAQFIDYFKERFDKNVVK